jgi:hypothetical protein
MTVVCAGIVIAWSAQAQKMGSGQQMMQDSKQQQESSQENKSDMMMPQGMMGGSGMGPGMMMGGPGMDYHGMMMGGSGMESGMGMMGKGYMMHRNMMAQCGVVPGMKSFSSAEEQGKFLDATKELRKNLHDMRFEYGEMIRQPETTIGELKKMEQQMDTLQKQIMEKAAPQ